MLRESVIIRPLKKRDDLHIARKLWHFIGVMMMAVFFALLPRVDSLQIMAFFASSFIIGDLIRLQFPRLNHFVLNTLHPFMRDSERKGLAGTTYLFIGVGVTIALFPPQVALLSLLFLAIADPLASYVGVLHGTDKIWKNKSVQGSFAALVSCTVIAALYFYSLNLMSQRLLIVSLIAGLIGAASELITIGKLDDNMTFPILSSSFLWGLYFIFGGF